MKQTIEDLDRDGQHIDFTLETPIQLAALLKKFFIDLPDPLLTHRLHTLFVATQSKLQAIPMYFVVTNLRSSCF
jgi:hypothetical protein